MNIVIAEDDYRVALLHEQYLESIFSVKVVGRALNGRELKELLHKEEVNLILLDIYFPDTLGVDLLPYIRMNYPHIDIIVISASDDRSHLQMAKRYGVYQYLIKPASVDAFTQTMEQYIADDYWYQQQGEFQQKDTLHILTGTDRKTLSTKESRGVLPTGIDSITLDKVMQALSEEKDGVTIDTMCEIVGISRTTARRYLEHIVAEGNATTKLNYGVIGRPERRYMIQ